MTFGFDASRAFNKNRTGTENYSFQILKHLSKIDTVNNYVVYVRPGTQVGLDWPPNFKFTTISLPRLWTQVGLALSTFTDPLDVLFIPSHTLPLLRKPGLKTVLTVHDLGAEYLPEHHQLKQRLYLNLMTHHQLSSATKLIAVSRATKDDLISKIQIPSSKISVVHEGYNQELFKPITGDPLNSVLNKYDLSKDNYFLFVGTIQPRKNLDRLIRAYNQWLKGKRDRNSYSEEVPVLVLAGSKGWLSDDIYKLPKQLGIEKSVKFLGYTPDNDLPALYSGAIAFVFPSLFEGFGLPILESQACGSPVITSSISSMPEVAGKAAILVNPYSIDSIAEGLKAVSVKREAERLKKEGFEQVKIFSWEKAARETLQVLTQVGRG